MKIGSAVPSPEDIEEALQKILEELGYSSPKEISRVFSSISPDFIKVVIIMLGLLCVVILVYAVTRIVSRSPFSVGEPTLLREKEEQELIERKDYSAFYTKATDLGKKGQYLEAVRMLYMGLLVFLDSRDVIKYHPSLTNYEYRVKVNPFSFSPFFEKMTRTFDTLYYGGRKATGEDFSFCMDAFTEIVEALS